MSESTRCEHGLLGPHHVAHYGCDGTACDQRCGGGSRQVVGEVHVSCVHGECRPHDLAFGGYLCEGSRALSIAEKVAALREEEKVCVDQKDVEAARHAWSEFCAGTDIPGSDDFASMLGAMQVLNFFFDLVVRIDGEET